MAEDIKMFDYSRKRTKKEIFLFYVANIIMGVFLAIAIKYILAAVVWGEDVPKYYYVNLGYVVSFVYTFLITGRIFHTKKLWHNVKAWVLAVFALISAPVLGLLAAFIPVSILMGFEPEK